MKLSTLFKSLILLFILSACQSPTEVCLPYLGICKYDTVQLNGGFKVDTILHTVADFSFTDQTGAKVKRRDFRGRICVADFFFTTCTSICPIMTNQMKRVVEAYKDEPDVLFLSHTVYPEQDSVSVLAAYAEKQNADPKRWHFVTGSKKDLYRMARKSYLLSSDTGNGDSNDFVHTQLFALVDGRHHVRGVYDGIDSLSVNKLITEIGILLKE